MSMFLPEGQGQAPGGAEASLAPPSPETTAGDVALMQRVLQAGAQSPNRIPEEFMAYILDWIQTQRLIIPIGQVFGYSQSLPSGLIFPFAGATAPSGYLLCDGTAISRTGYAALFSAIGTTYGAGDGSTTFNLPDLRGRVPVGYSSGGKTEVATLGGSDGITDATKRNISHHHVETREPIVANSLGTFNSNGPSASFESVSTSGDVDNTDKPAYLTLNFIVKT